MTEYEFSLASSLHLYPGSSQKRGRVGGCTFDIPGEVDENYQFETDKLLFCPSLGGCSNPNIYDQFSFGVYLKTMSTSFEVLSCTFNNLYEPQSDIFGSSRPVMGLHSAPAYPVIVTGSEFINLNEAIQIEGSNPMTIQENVFDN